MSGRRFVVVAALLAAVPLAASAQERAKVALAPPEGDAPPAVAARVATSLAGAAGAAGREVVRTAVPLDEVRLTVECPEPTPACTTVAGRNLGVAEVIQVRLKRVAGGLDVEVKLYDVAGARVARHVTQRLSAEPSDEELRQLGQSVFGLAPAVAPPPPPRPVQPRWRLRLRARTWVTAALGVSLLAIGGVMAGLTTSTQSDFDGTVNPAPDDVTAIRHFVDLADRGKTYATAANVCFGLGAAALAVGGVFFVLDWHRVEVQPMAGPRAAGLTLRRSF
jgi:hypothetical protein